MKNFEKAQSGLALLKEAVLAELRENSSGLGNAEIAKQLGIKSDFEGNQKDYLSYSILGLLISDKKVKYQIIGNRKKYFIK